jgi:hypothetical protein
MKVIINFAKIDYRIIGIVVMVEQKQTVLIFIDNSLNSILSIKSTINRIFIYNRIQNILLNYKSEKERRELKSD